MLACGVPRTQLVLYVTLILAALLLVDTYRRVNHHKSYVSAKRMTLQKETNLLHPLGSLSNLTVEWDMTLKQYGLDKVSILTQHTGSTINNCDADCQKMMESLTKWPSSKPKAAIYFLLKHKRYVLMVNALRSLYHNFNQYYNYPVIIFHEDQASPTVLQKLRDSSGNNVYLQEISFKVPSFLQMSVNESKPCHRKLGYRFMCRFMAKEIFQQPIIKGFTYLFRLDDDSLILSNVTYDLFRFMTLHDVSYGYRWITSDKHICMLGLIPATHTYINATRTQPTFYSMWPEYQIYYNNFEISRLDIWTSHEYKNYIEYLDRLGGIFYLGWGDAPIKTLAVTMFVEEKRTHQFTDVDYQHANAIYKQGKMTLST